MVRRISRVLLVLAAAGSGAGAFKFMSNLKMPTFISESQKVKLAETEARFGDRKLVVITGCSAGLGREAVKQLLATDDYHVVGAVRDVAEMEAVADLEGFDRNHFRIMDCELDSFESVQRFCAELADYRLEKPVDRLICNAGACAPSRHEVQWSADGHEQTMQVDFLAHFLLISRLLDGMKDAPDPRVLAVGSVAGHDHAAGGAPGGIAPAADLKQLDGFRAGFAAPIAMADGYGFDGAKARADARLALALTSRLLHAKFHKSHGVSFAAVDPGLVAAPAPVAAEDEAGPVASWPLLLQYVADQSGGADADEVDAAEAGRRVFQAAHDPKCGQSGVSWRWDGAPDALDAPRVADPSDEETDLELGVALFQSATAITGAAWPTAKTFRSPCPTLHVIGAVSKNMMMREELKRMAERPGFNEDGTVVKLTKRKRAALLADRVIVQGVLGNTVGRVGKVAGRLLLGRIPDTAKNGSFQEEKPEDEAVPAPVAQEVSAPSNTDIDPIAEESRQYVDVVNEGDKSLIEDLEEEIFEQVFATGTSADDQTTEGREWKVDAPVEQKELAKV